MRFLKWVLFSGMVVGAWTGCTLGKSEQAPVGGIGNEIVAMINDKERLQVKSIKPEDREADVVLIENDVVYEIFYSKTYGSAVVFTQKNNEAIGGYELSEGEVVFIKDKLAEDYGFGNKEN